MTPTDGTSEEQGSTTPSTNTYRVAIAKSLRAWARGVLPTEAAVELLISAIGGRLLNGPWVRPEAEPHVRYWFDTELAATESGYLSGGERRVLAIAASLAGGDPVDLSDAITGIDHEALRRVIAALEHAGGGSPSVQA